MQDKIDLLTKMRTEVIYTNVATMPIPLYEEMKAQLARLDDVEGLAKFLHNREMSVDISERDGWLQEEYIADAQAVINYIKGE